MPSKDIPGNQKHIRFGRISPELYDKLVTFPGVKSVVLHIIGKTGEHPHWHIWWEGEPITNVTWQNRWNKFIEPLPRYYGNGDWGFRNHDSWDAWAKYVTRNVSHKVLLGYKDIATISEQARIISLASPETPVTPVIPGPGSKAVKSQSRMRWDEKICFDAETRLGWKRNAEFSLSSLEDGLAQKQVERQVSSFMVMRINNNDGVKYARNLMYEFGDEDVKEYMERKVWEKISWI